MTHLRDEALRIGHQLSRSAFWHEGRCAWIAPVAEPDFRGRPRLARHPLDASLGDGTAGVALFLAEAAAATGDDTLRATATGAIRHATAAAFRSAPSPGLYDGTAGVAYAAIRVGHLLEDERWLDEADPLMNGCGSAMAPETDVAGGLAGTALGLCAALDGLGMSTSDPLGWLGDEILARGEWADGGLSWRTGPDEDRLGNLLGMLHGAAGIGLSLAELAAREARAELAEGARAAFRYGRHWRDPETGDWPNLHATTRTGARGPTFFASWCHGAPGIALSRIGGWRLLGDEWLRAEAEAALGITASALGRSMRADGADVCLCHGLAGSADVLLEGARSLPDGATEWQEMAELVADAGIDSYPASGRPWPCGAGGFESPGLLGGLAGVGMFLLRLSDPAIPPVLTIPAWETTHAP